MKWIKNNSHIVLVILALLTLFLGGVGYWGAIENPRHASALGPGIHDWLNAFLTAFSHLSLEGFEPPDGSELDWTSYVITASRVCGAVFVFFGAANLLAALTNDFGRIRFWIRSRFVKDLDLIVGLGWHGKELIEHIDSRLKLNDSIGGNKTIAIDYNPSDSVIDLCKKTNVVYLKADLNSQITFENLQIKNIRRVFLVTGNDELNAKILNYLKPLVKGGRRLRCHVGMRSPTLYNTFVESDDFKEGLDIRTFSDAEITAQLLFQQNFVNSFPASIKISRLVLLGNGLMCDSILFQWLQNQILEPNIKIQVDVLCSDADVAAVKFISSYPCFKIDSCIKDSGPYLTKRVIPKNPIWTTESVLPDIRFHKLPVSHGHQAQYIEDLILEPNKDCRCVVAIISDSLSESVGVGRAVLPVVQFIESLHKKNNNIFHTWIYLNTQDVKLYDQLKKSLNIHHNNMFVFRDFLGECSTGSISNDEVERAAMYVHAIYSNFQGDPKKLWFGEHDFEGARQPSSLWDRESSRLCASHAWVKREIFKRSQTNHKNITFQDISEITLYEMARIEHRRWCAVHLLKGWAPLVQFDSDYLQTYEVDLIKKWYLEKDCKAIARKRFRHLCLVPFDDLLRIEELMKLEGLNVDEVNKDEKIIIETERIIDYAKF